MLNQSCTLNSAISYAQEEFKKLDFNKIKQSPIYLNMFEYYLMGTYPPLKAMYPISVEEVFKDASGVYNLYLHIPFCQQLCTFCHFAKEINAKNERIENYLDALHKEIDMVARTLNEKAKIKTIFFGGGTPSILSASQIEKLFTHLNQVFEISKETEITFELHPGVIHQKDYEERIEMLKACGVNRWVSGVQSMDDNVLKKLNRGHTSRDVYELVNILTKHNIDNLSLDLIYGLPYQTIENWYDSITQLLSAGVTKYNIFPLMFKISDPITLHYLKEPNIFPSEEQRYLMHFIAEYLYFENGFTTGPIFYYSKSSLHSQQQKSKFEEIEEVNLLPLGVSSFGYVGHTQYNNNLEMDEYISTVNSGKLPVYLGYSLNIEERMRRNIMFSFRSNGINIPNYIAKFGTHPAQAFAKEFDLLKKLNLIMQEDDYIKLTKYGTLFSDGISLLFVSDTVKKCVMETNSQIQSHPLRRNLLEKYDFSPIHRLDHGSAKKQFNIPLLNESSQ